MVRVTSDESAARPRPPAEAVVARLRKSARQDGGDDLRARDAEGSQHPMVARR
jgi:hypothetical protein